MSATESDTRIAPTRKPYEFKDIDTYLMDMSLDRTMSELMTLRVNAPTMRTHFCANLILSAVFDLDIGLISEVVKRIDGIAPSKGDMDGYSDLFANALEDVLDYEQADMVRIMPGDRPIIALAKAAVCIANHDPRKNMMARKDRQKAVQLILDRTQGRRTESAKTTEEIEYTVPDWLGLPEGGEDEGDDEAEGDQA